MKYRRNAVQSKSPANCGEFSIQIRQLNHDDDQNTRSKKSKSERWCRKNCTLTFLTWFAVLCVSDTVTSNKYHSISVLCCLRLTVIDMRYELAVSISVVCAIQCDLAGKAVAMQFEQRCFCHRWFCTREQWVNHWLIEFTIQIDLDLPVCSHCFVLFRHIVCLMQHQ